MKLSLFAVMKLMIRMWKGHPIIVQETLSYPSLPFPTIHVRILAKPSKQNNQIHPFEKKQTPLPLPGITSNSFLRQWGNRKGKNKNKIVSAPSSSINPSIPSLSRNNALFVQMHLHQGAIVVSLRS